MSEPEPSNRLKNFFDSEERKPTLAENSTALSFNNRGQARLSKSELDGAISDFNKAIELNPNLAEAYNNRGLLKQKLGQIDEAMMDLDKAIELKSKQI